MQIILFFRKYYHMLSLFRFESFLSSVRASILCKRDAECIFFTNLLYSFRDQECHLRNQYEIP